MQFIPVVIGGVSLLVAVAVWLAERRAQAELAAWFAAALEAEGTVRISERNLSRNKVSGDDSDPVPVVRFRAIDGVEYEFDARYSELKAGERVRVAYSPTLHSDARLLSDRGSGHRGSIAIAVLAALLLGYGIYRNVQ